MPDVAVSALTFRQQKLVENARIAFELGNLDYVLDVCNQVLKTEVGCVAVRRLQRKARLLQFEEKNRLLAREQGGLSSTPFIFSSAIKNPPGAMVSAEKILAVDPTSTSALKLMAEAALGMDLPETAAFALEAVQELDPEDGGNLLALGEAWLRAGRPEEALHAADALLKLSPLDVAGQNLMRKAAIARSAKAAGKNVEGVFLGALSQDRPDRAGAQEPPSAGVHSEQATRQLLAQVLDRVAQEPNHLEHYRAIVAAHRQLGELQEALSWVRKARQVSGGSTDTTLEKQESELEAALLEVNVRMAESAMMAAPGDSEALARVKAAKSELASFRLFEAKRHSDRFPNDLAARYALGRIYLESGQYDAAIIQFRQTQPQPAVRVGSLIGLGRAFKEKKMYDLAVVQFTIAKVELGPMDDQKKEVI